MGNPKTILIQNYLAPKSGHLEEWIQEKNLEEKNIQKSRFCSFYVQKSDLAI
jgi:hypothetical protein